MIPNYPKVKGKDNIVICTRASDPKQAIVGDPHKNQQEQCESFLQENEVSLKKVIKTFRLVESGAKEERHRFNDMIDFCENPDNKVGLLLFANVSRLTRKGQADLFRIKEELEKYDVAIQDTKMTFGVKKSGLSHLGFTTDDYRWSEVGNTDKIEADEADGAKEDYNKTLNKLIGAQFNYIKQGYRGRNANFGYENIKVSTPAGLRSILEPKEPEAGWVIKMFELRANSEYTDQQIVDIVNKLGYVSRTRTRWKENTNGSKTPVGKISGIKLKVGQMRDYISNPIYAGIFVERWGADGRIKVGPLKDPYSKELVSVDLFNKANRGKVVIKVDGERIQILKNQKPILRLFNNPKYPYKKYILCPVCKKPLKASASTGKSGKKFPAYHCSRGHSRFSVKASDLENTVLDFAHSLEFTDEHKKEIRDSVLSVWKEKESEANTEALDIEKRLVEIRERKQQIKELLPTVGGTSPALQKDLGKEYQELDDEQSQLIPERNKEEHEEMKVSKFIKYCELVMEHPWRVLADTTNPLDAGQAFSAFFNTLPTYEDLVSGTPDLKPIYQLSKAKVVQKDSLVTPRRIELRLPG